MNEIVNVLPPKWHSSFHRFADVMLVIKNAHNFFNRSRHSGLHPNPHGAMARTTILGLHLPFSLHSTAHVPDFPLLTAGKPVFRSSATMQYRPQKPILTAAVESRIKLS